jgi:type II secretory ATPase GspE/PulE/Tfp pilus assembly ATPase PilB-like protein
MDDKTPEWVFDQDEDDLEGESESSSSSVVDSNEEDADSLVTKSEQDSVLVEDEVFKEVEEPKEIKEPEHKTEVLAEDGSTVKEEKEPVWEEESTVFEDTEDFIEASTEEEEKEMVLTEETPVEKVTTTEEPVEKTIELQSPAPEEKPIQKTAPVAPKGPNVADSPFESSGWDMFGGVEAEVTLDDLEVEETSFDDTDFISQLKDSKSEGIVTDRPADSTIIDEQDDIISEEVVDSNITFNPQYEDSLNPELPDSDSEKQDISVLSDEDILEEVDELLGTNDLVEQPVESLNEEIETLLSPVESADITPTVITSLDENDGSISSEDVFNEDSLVLKRDEKSNTKTSIVEDTVSDDHEDFYLKILSTLEGSEDLGLTPATRQKIRDAMHSDLLPQIAIKELISQRVIGKIQLARAATRSQGHQEIMSFLDVPQEATLLRKELDPKAVAYLRENRIIPISRETSSQGESTLNLAYESTFRDLVKESDLRELLPDYRFFWHFALREVCGAFWLSGDDDDVDSGMEAEALLDRIVTNAIDARSSDIHIDPSIKGEPRAVVKYRIDGFVTPKEVITQDQLERVRVRIENIARMPKVNQNHPNKGAFSRAGFDWRVQIQPHAGRQGAVPRIVIRRLQPDVLAMETLGYPQYFIDDINSAANSPNGVLFWTGPTGSGKTESIHSAIVSVNPMGKGLSVHTIEDPPEKRVSGYAVQMELSDQDPMRSGMELLKSSLRADPDVIIFGEVRDAEMAGLVFEAANTGHLVFSTLHTNTALDAIVRLDELGIYGFLVSYIRGIAAQRLIRRLCVHCRQAVEEVDEFTKSIFDKYEVETEGANLFKSNPEGCASCNHSGYHGRIAICEWLTPNQELVEISTRREYEDLERVAIAAGWTPMAYMGGEFLR